MGGIYQGGYPPWEAYTPGVPGWVCLPGYVHPFHCWACRKTSPNHPFHCWASRKSLSDTRFTVGLWEKEPSDTRFTVGFCMKRASQDPGGISW